MAVVCVCEGGPSSVPREEDAGGVRHECHQELRDPLQVACFRSRVCVCIYVYTILYV